MAIPRPPKSTKWNPYCDRCLEGGKMHTPNYCTPNQGWVRENCSSISSFLTVNSIWLSPQMISVFDLWDSYGLVSAWLCFLLLCLVWFGCFGVVFFLIALDENHKSFGCWKYPILLLAASLGRFIFYGKQRVGGGRRKQPPGSALPSPPASRGGKKSFAGCDLDENAPLQLLGNARLHPLLWTNPSLSVFTFKSASRGWTLTTEPGVRA